MLYLRHDDYLIVCNNSIRFTDFVEIFVIEIFGKILLISFLIKHEIISISKL